MLEIRHLRVVFGRLLNSHTRGAFTPTLNSSQSASLFTSTTILSEKPDQAAPENPSGSDENATPQRPLDDPAALGGADVSNLAAESGSISTETYMDPFDLGPDQSFNTSAEFEDEPAIETGRGQSQMDAGLRDILKAMSLARATPPPQPSPTPSADAEFMSVAAELNEEEERARAAEHETHKAAAPAPPPEKPPPHLRLLHQKYGYAVLGGINPEAKRASFSEHLGQSARLHPTRVFMPGDTYEPEDLNSFAPPRSITREPFSRDMPSEEEVVAYTDYKNINFLGKFLTEGGLLKSRRETKLTKPVQRRMAKSVKLARRMALIAHEARLDKMWLRKIQKETAQQGLSGVEKSQVNF